MSDELGLYIPLLTREATYFFFACMDHRPPTFRITNTPVVRPVQADLIDNYRDHDRDEVQNAIFDRVPPLELAITDDRFDLAYFSDTTFKFASARLREAFGLSDDVVKYRAVDSRGSCAAVQAADYAIYRAVQGANPFDQSRTPGAVRTIRRWDGDTFEAWRPDYGSTNFVFDMVFDAQFVAPAPMFRVVGTMWTVVTQEVVDRVNQAGLTGFYFSDLTRSSGPSPFR